MKAHLLYPDRDFDTAAELPAGHQDLVADLELDTVLDAMANGDKFLRDISARVMLASVTDPAEVRYRQQRPPDLEGAHRDRAPDRLFVRDPPPGRSRRPGAERHVRPRHQPGGQRGRSVS